MNWGETTNELTHFPEIRFVTFIKIKILKVSLGIYF